MTGVQTCALPIFLPLPSPPSLLTFSFSPFTYLTFLSPVFLCTFLGMLTRSNTSSVRISNNASERTVQRVRALAEEALRYTLFALRRETLWAETRILEVIHVFDTASFLQTNNGFPYSAVSFDYSRQKTGRTFIILVIHSVYAMPLLLMFSFFGIV